MSNWSEQLKNLPAHEPPAGGWSELQQRMRRARGRKRAAYAGFALAASVTLAVGLLLSQPRPQAVAPPGAEAAQLGVAELMGRSRQLESTLAQVRPQAQNWNRRLASTASNLQNELAVVDLQLNYADDAGARRLWQDRVELMSQLVQAHQQASRRTGRNTDQGSKEEIAI